MDKLIEEKDRLINEYKRNAMWANFLLDNYRKSHRIIPNRFPKAGDACYCCGKIFVYSYKESKRWFVFESGIATCKGCRPSQVWLDHVINVCENKHLSCSSTYTGETDFSVTSRWLTDLLEGHHTYYCTDT